MMQTGVILALALIPVYILVFSLAVNVVLYKTRPAFKTAFINPSHRIPATIRFLLPYPISAYGVTTISASRPETNSSTISSRDGHRETRQRAELRPVTLPPPAGTPATNTSGRSRPRAGATAAGSSTAATSSTTRVATRGGRRWGRTGSQRSTQTLPLYSEDVGDEDVVLIAKRESMRSMQSARSRRGRGDDDIEEEGESTEDEVGEELDEEVIQDHEHEDESQQSATQSLSGPAEEPLSSHGRDRSASIVSSTSIQERGWGEAPAYEDVMLNTPRLGTSLRMSEDLPRGSQDTSMAADISRVYTGDSAQAPFTTTAVPRNSMTGTGTAAGFRSFVGRLTGRMPASSGAGGRYSGVEPSPRDAENGNGTAWDGGSSEAYLMTGRPRGLSSASATSQLTVDPAAARRPSISSGMQRFRSNTGGIPSTNNSLVSLLLHPTMSNQSDTPAPGRFHYRGRSASNADSIPEDPSSPSASVINLGISSPVPGSVIRSAYIPPRAGFSNDQLKFLSSTESLGKYGANFGPDEAASGLGPTSQLNTTRSRSGSASSVGLADRNHSLHTRGQSLGPAAYVSDTSADGPPTFEQLLREEAAADETRRQSEVQAGDSGVMQEVPISEPPMDPEDSTQPSVPAILRTQMQPPPISVPLPLPNFDLEVVPPTPIIEQNRRSFISRA
ncbi:hypothetical protein QFC22_001810 [Naganishia vaughanmartiniae]|uniref:Uncharacterized protein n=1 Tax=Naganishia vaughanmartiniae TaxID=1424756 RepID=A0ACC2XFH6_9TREE|nr:hypothetical protein QFC22_001810 [Naganishia vaughanmartiniae]